MAITRIKDGRKVLTGQMTTNTYQGAENRIQLFDGTFKTGYRIVSFRIAPTAPTGGFEVIAKLSTEPKSSISQWNWQDVQELAWSGWNISNSSSDLEYQNVREDNLVIEDLWMSIYATGEAFELNYEIILDKYNMTDWDGAGVLVENLAQGGPN